MPPQPDSAAALGAVASFLPAALLTNERLAAEFPEWSAEKIRAKTGIEVRHVVGDDEYASDLAVGAVRALRDEHGIDLDTVDYLIVCTQSADHVMPATSLLVHGQLGLRQDVGATDITHGCSGYVYALGLAKGLIESGQVEVVLVVTTDTYTRYLNPADRSVRTLFGDGATATVVSRATAGRMHSFVYGSDGSGGGALVVPNGGLRPGAYPAADPAARGLVSNGYDLYMDGPEVFNFTLRVVPDAVDRVLTAAGLARDDIDTWIFHQANAFMLTHLRRKLGIPEERFVVEIADVGNTVSSTIPIALERARRRGAAQPGTRSLLLGFGVGLSWAGAIVEW